MTSTKQKDCKISLLLSNEMTFRWIKSPRPTIIRKWNKRDGIPSERIHPHLRIIACKIFAKIVPQKIICGRVRPWFRLVPLKEFLPDKQTKPIIQIPLFKVFRWNVVIQTQPITRRTRLWIPCNEPSSTMGEHGASANGYKMKLHTTFATRLTI